MWSSRPRHASRRAPPLEHLDQLPAPLLLATIVRERLDDRLRDRVSAEAAGNPLAITVFSRENTEAPGAVRTRRARRSRPSAAP